MDTAAIEAKGLAPVQPLLDEIDGLGNGEAGKQKLAELLGKLGFPGAPRQFGIRITRTF